MARLCAVALASCGAPYRSAGAWPWTGLPDLPFDAGYRQPDADLVGVAQVLCLADACLYRHKITPLLRKEGRFPLAAANADFYRDHAPAVGNEPGDGPQQFTLLFRNPDEVERGGSPPVPDLSAEIELHAPS